MANTDTSLKITRQYLGKLRSHWRFMAKMITKPKHVEINGVTLEVPDHYSPRLKSLFYQQRYECSEAKCVIEKLEPDDLIVEFGAGIGYISTLCAKLIGSDRVFAYEANPILIPMIKKTFETNNVHPTLTEALLGCTTGKTSFFLQQDFFSSSIHKRTNEAREMQVSAVDINHEISRLNPTFLIIDVEGGEYDLVSYIDWRGIKKILIELHEQIIGKSNTDEIRAKLTKYGFTVDPGLSSARVVYLERIEP